jgi:hypothetical protein
MTDVQLELREYNFGIYTRHAEIVMEDTDHGELQIEMTKPMEAI